MNKTMTAMAMGQAKVSRHTRGKVVRSWHEPRLLRRLQLALKPAYRPFGFQGIWPIAIKALERARPLPSGGSAKIR